jgi:hypothetical protein
LAGRARPRIVKEERMITRCLRRLAGAGAIAVVGCLVLAIGAQAKAKPKVLTVCKHGCRYTTIQSAVNASGKNATISVKPGKYVEGVIVSGHKHDGLHIIGDTTNPAKVLIEGKKAKGPGGAAQNGIEGDDVNNMVLENMKAEHFAANGFYVNHCTGYLMKNLVAGFEHSYGLFAFRCVGGRMTDSVGYGNGDSAFYIGGTPFEKHPVWSSVDHDTGYENVLGYSGTNSKYVTIRNSQFYNNGAGVVPNTLVSEPDQPADTGVIEDNLIFWNNFDYYRASSPVKTVSGGVGSDQANYPIGAGVILFGTTNWTVKDNSIFGNFLWGAAAFSDPTNSTGKAENNDNKFLDNKMGAAFRDTNGVDFFNDGSGKGTCFAGNTPGATLDVSATAPDLYPACPSSAGTGTVNGDGNQVLKLLAIVSSNPPSKMESFWHTHSHPPRKGRKPYEG